MKSEHCIGFLKGQFNSLHGLQVQINSQQNLAFASLLIVACIVIHNFSLKMECADGTDFNSNTFFLQRDYISFKKNRTQHGNKIGSTRATCKKL